MTDDLLFLSRVKRRDFMIVPIHVTFIYISIKIFTMRRRYLCCNRLPEVSCVIFCSPGKGVHFTSVILVQLNFGF